MHLAGADALHGWHGAAAAAVGCSSLRCTKCDCGVLRWVLVPGHHTIERTNHISVAFGSDAVWGAAKGWAHGVQHTNSWTCGTDYAATLACK